ncbi:MAG: 50S ribosome-binding GTPase, partial [Bacteroidales bacterium]|nr:50S ribosome-binding GTPase [Bacteroidales bacterium]
LIPDAVIKLVKYAPLGDPMEIMVHGYALTLRKADATLIEVEPCPHSIEAEGIDHQDDERLYITTLHDHNAHPGLGEEGIYHDKTHEHPLPKGSKLTFALAGQQNCGKTTLFNQLTGANQHVGNFPNTASAGTATSKCG